MAASRHVVIAGGSFAGLAAAYTLRDTLRPEDRITVVDPNPHFVFTPSLVRAALGEPLMHGSFSLDAALTARNIEYVQGHVRNVRADGHVVHTDAGDLTYDRLIVATGGRPDPSRVPGLAGEFRSASWIVGEDSALEARNALRAFFEHPGPLVIGAAQGAAYFSGVYELVLSIETELRRRGIREGVEITFVTAEPHVGHLGTGQTAARAKLTALFTRRGIASRAGVSILRVEPDSVRLSDGTTLHSRLAIIMPPFTGAVDIWKSANLTDMTGMIPVTPEYRHVREADIYAAGTAAYFAQPVPPIGCDRPPGTGYLAVRMGRAAAQNVAASLGCGAPASRTLPHTLDVRVVDAGDTGLLLLSRGSSHLSHRAITLPGSTARHLKSALERYIVRQLRTGRSAHV